jgi:hypothetical protein
MSAVVRQAFARGLIDPVVTNHDLFREDLGQTLADPERVAGFNPGLHHIRRVSPDALGANGQSRAKPA